MSESPWLCNRELEPIVFCKTTEPYGWLHNMCKGYAIRVNGVSYDSSEHLYQSMRFTESEHVDEVRLQPNAFLAKEKARELMMRGFGTNSDHWETIKVGLMTFCLCEKFNQNYKIKQQLIETYPTPLVEYSAKDSFWGAKKNETGKYVGKNTLGKLLMKLRLELKAQQNLEFKS